VELIAYLGKIMKNKILLSLSIFFLIFCFIVLFKSLNNSNIYVPDSISEKPLINFNSQDLFSNKKISSDQIFTDSEFYILNIWASWCLPCRNEHSYLMEFNKNSSIKLIGLNYKDNPNSAKKFINEFGNPYSVNIVDLNGTISIKLGAYGVPETFLINKEKKIIKKIVGPLNKELVKEINLIIK
jgi:cytochrome c biogenesis protein CcmG/thiol:disulfide interchange protein DsbE